MFLGHATGGAVYLDDPELLAAYRAFFFPQTFAKVRSVLEEIAWTGASVLDLGAAMGGAAFAAWSASPASRLELVDFSDAALLDGMRLGSVVGASVRTKKQRLDALTFSARYDLVIAANALSELPSIEARIEACRAVVAGALTPGGRFLLIEPADRVHARALQELRDRLLGVGLRPVAPCPHDGPCPASVRPRDFCHQAREVAMPEWFTALQDGVGISDRRMRFSYLVYGGEPRATDALVRVISNPIKDKGRLRFFGCARSGLTELLRQDKHASEANAAFDTLGRGALIRMAAPERVTKVGAETRIEIVRQLDTEEND